MVRHRTQKKKIKKKGAMNNKVCTKLASIEEGNQEPSYLLNTNP